MNLRCVLTIGIRCDKIYNKFANALQAIQWNHLQIVLNCTVIVLVGNTLFSEKLFWERSNILDTFLFDLESISPDIKINK